MQGMSEVTQTHLATLPDVLKPASVSHQHEWAQFLGYAISCEQQRMSYTHVYLPRDAFFGHADDRVCPAVMLMLAELTFK